MSPRNIRPISTPKLAALSTPRLLAYKARLMVLEDTAEGSDWNPNVLAALDPALVYFKDDPRWRELHETLRALLSKREHVPK